MEEHTKRYEELKSQFEIPEEIEKLKQTGLQEYSRFTELSNDKINFYKEFINTKIKEKILESSSEQKNETINFKGKKFTYQKTHPNEKEILHSFQLDTETEAFELHLTNLDSYAFNLKDKKQNNLIVYSSFNQTEGIYFFEGKNLKMKLYVMKSDNDEGFQIPLKDDKSKKFYWRNEKSFKRESFGLIDLEGNSEPEDAYLISEAGTHRGKFENLNFYSQRIFEKATGVVFIVSHEGNETQTMEWIGPNFTKFFNEFDPGNLEKRKGKQVEFFENVTIKKEGTFQGDDLVKGRIELGSQIFDGEFDTSKGYLEFEGTFTSENGQTYKGRIENNHFEGEGELTSPDGTVYTGNFKHGLRSGHGILENKEKNFRFEGEFENDSASGYGVEEDGGHLYEGMFKGGKKHGEGVLLDRHHDSQFKGKFENGLPHGRGVFQSKSFHYEGDIYEGKKQGQGVLYLNETRATYEGEFGNDLQHGEGKFLFDDESFFEGRFEEGNLIEGKVCFTFEHLGLEKEEGRDFAVEYEGTLKEGKYEGHGELLEPSGNRYIGEFKDGFFEGEGYYYPVGFDKGVFAEWEQGKMRKTIKEVEVVSEEKGGSGSGDFDNVVKFSGVDDLKRSYFGNQSLGYSSALSVGYLPWFGRGIEGSLASRRVAVFRQKANVRGVNGNPLRFVWKKNSLGRKAVKILRRGLFKF